MRVVIDSGLQRIPRYEPDAGVTRLETVRVSRASADQRRGRAGRTEPGVCYRLWDEPQTASLRPFTEPEIRAADLSGLLLDCAEWGVTDPAQLSWLDPPSPAAVTAARADLVAIGALDADGRLTRDGQRMRALPLPPRLAAMVIAAARISRDAAATAADIAALLVERGLGGNDADLDHRLVAFRRDRARRAEDMRRMAAGWARSAIAAAGQVAGRTSGGQGASGPSAAALLMLAYPDRIAKARGAPGQFLLAGGRGGALDPSDSLAQSPYLVVAELQGSAAATRILLAARISEAEIVEIAGERITETEALTFDPDARAVRARRVRRLDAITLGSEQRQVQPGPETAALLAAGLAKLGAGKSSMDQSAEPVAPPGGVPARG